MCYLQRGLFLWFTLKHHRSNINHYFTWAIISNAPKNTKTRKNLEASYIALWKPDLDEQKDFERLEMVSHKEINDIKQTPKKKVHFFFFSVCFIVFNCSWQLVMFDKKQKIWVKHIYFSNWWWFIWPKSFLQSI